MKFKIVVHQVQIKDDLIVSLEPVQRVFSPHILLYHTSDGMQTASEPFNMVYVGGYFSHSNFLHLPPDTTSVAIAGIEVTP